MTSTLRWGLLLTLLPVAAAAQTTPRIYVGASAVLLRTAPFSSYGTSHAGPAATIGVQLNERWAVETGFQAVWYSASDYQDFTGSTSPISYSSSLRSTSFLVPVLARLTLTRAQSPLRVDLLGGLNLVRKLSTFTQSVTENGVTRVDDFSGNVNNINLAFGPQVRYALGTRFEAKLNVPLNVRLNNKYGAFSDQSFLNPQLGLQYTFN